MKEGVKFEILKLLPKGYETMTEEELRNSRAFDVSEGDLSDDPLLNEIANHVKESIFEAKDIEVFEVRKNSLITSEGVFAVFLKEDIQQDWKEVPR